MKEKKRKREREKERKRREKDKEWEREKKLIQGKNNGKKRIMYTFHKERRKSKIIGCIVQKIHLIIDQFIGH